jgi:hypothetical protein
MYTTFMALTGLSALFSLAVLVISVAMMDPNRLGRRKRK